MASCISSSRFIINLIIIIIIIIFPVSITAQRSPYRNVTLGSSIVANADSSPTWASPSGIFAFGFRQVAGGGFLLAIWFDQTPNKTIVWSANRDNPVPSGSTLRLSAQGMLELFDDGGRRIWDAARLARSGTADHGAMLDTGNFVIATNTSAVVWQSFDSPTDTLLPGQILNRGGVLVSSFSQTNYSKGRFMLTMQRGGDFDGNLELNTRSFPLDGAVDRYWSSNTVESGFRLIFNQTGGIYVAQANGTVLKPLFKTRATVGQFHFHQILILEYDGVLRHYHVYPNSSAAVQDFLPPNICENIEEEDTGGGACGFNSICTMETDGRPSCSCPLRYTSRGGLNGCVPDFKQHRCDEQSQDAKNFRLEVMYNVDWPVMNYANFMNVADEEWCRQSCLDDCYCAVAVSHSNRCYKKSLPFANGRMKAHTFSFKAFIKVRINNNTVPDRNTSVDVPSTNCQSKNSSNVLVITLSVLLGCSVLLYLLSSVLSVFCFKRRASSLVQASRVHPAGVSAIRKFGFDELHEATKGFKDELGKGACSKVYKGTLEDSQKVVAVKKLDKIAQESDLEFLAEVSSISRTNHRNLVQLLGYCDEGQHKILVYEFMSNGSLANLVFQSSSRPNWYRRMQIAFEIARGLCYLHEECSSPIIHCDIKPQNVLLDESYTPKISDFGLAKLMRPDQTRTTTGIRGTRGYVAPEWFRNMPVTVKVDVYSYGILLLELVCCRKSYEADAENEEQVVLADWAYDCYQEGVLDALVEGDVEAKSEMKMVERLVMIAIWCIQEDPTLRPHMKRVMHMLEGSIQVPPPPNPSVFIS